MEYNRKEIKRAARATLRETRPRPGVVTFVYFLLTLLMGVILMLAMWAIMMSMLPQPIYGFADTWSYGFAGSGPGLGMMTSLTVFLYVLMILLALVMQFGYLHYTMNVWYRRPSGYRDLFRGFSSVGRILLLSLLVFVFTLLWTLPAAALWSAVVFGTMRVLPMEIAFLVHLVCYLLFLAFLLERTLRYAMAPFLLLDHPELTARQALNESKALMVGRRWKLMVLELSFMGWFLLIPLAVYAVMIPSFLLADTLRLDQALAVILLAYVVALVAASAVSAWISAYRGVAVVGFYEAATSHPLHAAPMGTRDVEVPSDFIPTMIPPVLESPPPTPAPPASTPTPPPAQPTPPPVPQEEEDDEPEW